VFGSVSGSLSHRTACLSLEEDAYMLIMIFYLHNLRQCACLSLEDCLVWNWLQGGEKGSKTYEISDMHCIYAWIKLETFLIRGVKHNIEGRGVPSHVPITIYFH